MDTQRAVHLPGCHAALVGCPAIVDGSGRRGRGTWWTGGSGLSPMVALASPCHDVQGTRVGEASGEPAQCLSRARRDVGTQEGRSEHPQSPSTLQGQT